MRNKLLILLTLFSLQAMACELSNGKLEFKKFGDTYKVFLSEQPVNTCFAYDSIKLSISVRCKMTGMTENLSIGLHDTLTYHLDGVTILTGSVRWYFSGGNWIVRSFSSICKGFGSGCFEKVPDLSNPLPPIFVPELTITNGLIESNVGGTLVMVNMENQYEWMVNEFAGPFQYQMPPGQWLLYLLLGDGSELGKQIILIP